MNLFPVPSSNGAPRRVRFWLRTAGLALGVFITIAGVTYLILNEPLPTGTPGAAADSLARRMMAAIGHENWERTGAIRWQFAGKHHHLWDKKRHLARVRWDGVEVLLHLADISGRARRNGAEISGKEASQLVRAAWEKWCNDAFWLNPVSKIFDPGTVRELVPQPAGGRPGLLVRYTRGGVTPGDAYLWQTGADDLPVSWKMWVKIIPLGGMEFSWEQWIILSTGVKIATLHRSGPIRVELTEVAAAPTLAELEPGEDPFAPLFRAEWAGRSAPGSGAAVNIACAADAPGK